MPRFAGVLLVDPAGRLLLQERDEHPAIDPEKWGLSGGHLDDDEAPEAGAYRELAEETGVRLAPGTLLHWRDIQVFHTVYDSLDTMSVYAAATALTDADIVCGEGRRIVFVDPAVAVGLDLTAAAALVVPAFLESTLYARLRSGQESRRSDPLG